MVWFVICPGFYLLYNYAQDLNENLPMPSLDRLTIYMAVGVIVGLA